MCSIFLQQIKVCDIGPYLDGSDIKPLLKMGVKIAEFQSLVRLLKYNINAGASSFATSFNS